MEEAGAENEAKPEGDNWDAGVVGAGGGPEGRAGIGGGPSEAARSSLRDEAGTQSAMPSCQT